jgi:hypothetical protein
MPAEPNWRTSSYSGQTSSCVEIAAVGKAIAIRDSKDRAGTALRFGAAAFQAFVTAVRDDCLQPTSCCSSCSVIASDSASNSSGGSMRPSPSNSGAINAESA